MTIPQEHIKMLNNINSATQRAGLGDILAQVEEKASGGNIEEKLNAFREEFNEILEAVDALGDRIDALASEDKYSGTIRSLESSVSSLSSKLDKHIDSTPPVQTE